MLITKIDWLYIKLFREIITNSGLLFINSGQVRPIDGLLASVRDVSGSYLTREVDVLTIISCLSSFF